MLHGHIVCYTRMFFSLEACANMIGKTRWWWPRLQNKGITFSPSTVLLYNLSIQNLVQNIFPNDFSRRVPCQLARHNAILPETEDNFCSIANKTKEKLWCQGGSNSHCCSLYFKELEIKRNTSNDLSRETETFSQLATWYYEKRFEDTQLNYLLSTSSLKLNLPFLKNINGRQKPFVVLKRVFFGNYQSYEMSENLDAFPTDSLNCTHFPH